MYFLDPQANKDGSYSKLALGLAATFESLRSNMKYAKVTKRTRIPELEKVINQTYNSNFKVVVNPQLRCNANVSMPLGDRNNIMWRELYRDYFSEELDRQGQKDLYKSSDNILTGEITQTGKLKGYFSKLESTITISHDMIFTRNAFRVNKYGAAGIVLHEIGHFMNYLKALGWNVRINYVLTQTHNRLMGVGDRTTRVKIIESITNAEGLDISEDVNTLAKLNDPKTTSTVIVGSMHRKLVNELGNNVFDARGFEALSDNFATQHGCGLDLVKALDAMPGMSMAKKGTVASILTTALGTAFMLVAIPVTAPLTVLLTLLYDPESKIYDDPKERIQRINQQLIQQLKENKRTDNSKLIKDIEAVNKIAKQYKKDNRDLIQILNETLMPSGRRNRSLRELNQNLEEFSNNHLYVAAAQLSTLGD